jgi:hypothetical protein
MRHISLRRLGIGLCALVLVAAAGVPRGSARPDEPVSPSSGPTLGQFVDAIRGRAKTAENTSGMRVGFASFSAAHGLSPASIRYSDFVVVRLLFEATRDAGFWNLHWTITNQPPNSDNVWRQWEGVRKPSPLTPTASAECDELSALYAFLAERAGIKGIGLFWPYANHTVAVWVVHPADRPVFRVVVPTSQIFLDETDFFDTRKFNPWRQKTIYEYTRRDVPESFELPKALADYFLRQVDRYAGASDVTLQKLRYLREGVFLEAWSPHEAARVALEWQGHPGFTSVEDVAALHNFAEDMGSDLTRGLDSPR